MATFRHAADDERTCDRDNSDRETRIMSSLLLAIDAGNTRVKFGLFDSPSDAPGLPICGEFAAVHCDEPAPWTTIRNWVDDDRLHLRCVMTGSNPRALAALRAEWPSDFPEPETLTNHLDFPLTIALPSPERVGIDRLLNAVAANSLRASGQPAIIVDSGTATTVDALNSDGAFVGGAILPGLELSARALHEYTALLPEVPRTDFTSEGPQPVGHDTISALRSGIFWGQVGAITHLVDRLSQALHDPRAPACLTLLTGGGGPLLRPHLPSAYRWEPALPMQGLALTVERSRTDESPTKR